MIKHYVEKLETIASVLPSEDREKLMEVITDQAGDEIITVASALKYATYTVFDLKTDLFNIYQYYNRQLIEELKNEKLWH